MAKLFFTFLMLFLPIYYIVARRDYLGGNYYEHSSLALFAICGHIIMYRLISHY